jgi:hypothetical protein
MLKSVSFAGLLCRGRVLLGLGALSLIAACGGSVSRVETFVPQKMVVFGDEMSLLPDDGSGKYSINALQTGGVTLDCANNLVWPQYLAGHFGLVFKGCPGTATVYTAEMHAAAGATVAAVTQQVAAYRSGGGAFNAKTLFTLQSGMYDIKAAYDGYVTAGENAAARSAALAQVEAAGTALGALVNDMIGGNLADGSCNVALGRVLYVTAPNLALSPFGIAQNAINSARGTLLTDLTNAFNSKLRSAVANNGQCAGPVFADTQVANMANTAVASTSYALSDRIHPACTTALPGCTTSTLQDSTVTPALVTATSTNYLWADDTRLGPVAHTLIGAAAVARAVNNPF